MYSLIMGLQHELGISPVVANFGPGTAAKFAELGDIGFGWEENRNILRLLQFGLWGKGYWAVEPESEGWFTGVTRAAVGEIRSDMGIGGEGVINVKVAECLFNMDAYVVVAGGSNKIRTIQQWLNRNYWTRSAGSIGPADGVYSRDVQKALMVALQYELGIAHPNGNFGPGTKAGLQRASSTLSAGDSGILVSLFTAACVFNEPVPIEQGVRTTFKSTFDESAVEFVKLYQKFSYLKQNGKGDYDTWAQLLVSMGNPDRGVTASDTRYVIDDARAQWLYENDYRMVGRYLYSPDPTYEKEILPGELETILAHDMQAFPIFQVHGRSVTEYNYTNGYQHALLAHEKAEGFGINRGTTIYFAVDYDATQPEIDAYVIPYFQGIVAGLASRGRKYVHGVYGSRNVCIDVTSKTFARYSFVSGMSWGFSGNLGFPLPANWAFNQIKEIADIPIDGTTIDLDNDVWRPDSDRGINSLNDVGGPADDFIAYVQELYDLAGSYDSDGRGRSQLVMEYIRHREYGNKGTMNELGWWYLIGSYDEGFVKYCNDRGMSVKKSFTDPYTQYPLGVEHMMATANAQFLTAQPDNKKGANGGDVGGWAGDLMTFWAGWRNSEEEYANPLDFAHAKLAVPGVASTFGFADLIEDADGYLLARAVRGGKNIVDAVKDHYNGGGGLSRFNDFFSQRWGSGADCKDSAHNALTALEGTLAAAQLYLVTGSGAVLPSDYQNVPNGLDNLHRFEQGFVDALLARMGMENERRSQYLKNHDVYLSAARQRSARRDG
ncbi:hypothetical protein N566_01705 [Streptomycetaceae bacterium MP113-05]|nr:hypothetical protein N566_01705 [Streptomycetaceae bacterium MP113-05]